MPEYAQGQSVTLYANFKNRDGSPLLLSGTPQVRVFHFDTGGNTKEDVAFVNMTIMDGTISTYSYDYPIPARADKTTYNAMYSGTSVSGGVNLIGTETFHIVPQKFYRRKAGGLVINPSAARRDEEKEIWTEDEKDKVIDLLNKLDNKKISFKSLEDNIKKTVDSISLLSAVVESQKDSILNEQNKIATELKNKGDVTFDDSKILQNIKAISESLGKLDIALRNDRQGLVISSLEDLKEDITDFKLTFITTLPTEMIGRIKNDKNE